MHNDYITILYLYSTKLSKRFPWNQPPKKIGGAMAVPLSKSELDFALQAIFWVVHELSIVILW